MTTSMQMAQECLKHEEAVTENADDSGSFEGLEAFAKTIESGKKWYSVCLPLVVAHQS